MAERNPEDLATAATLATEWLDALGLPGALCQSLKIEVTAGDAARITATYFVKCASLDRITGELATGRYKLVAVKDEPTTPAA